MKFEKWKKWYPFVGAYIAFGLAFSWAYQTFIGGVWIGPQPYSLEGILLAPLTIVQNWSISEMLSTEIIVPVVIAVAIFFGIKKYLKLK